jgi:hypothetical protein
MAWRSASGNPLSHSRTGSRPASARKKISGIFRGGESSGACTLFSTCVPYKVQALQASLGHRCPGGLVIKPDSHGAVAYREFA